MYKNTACHGIKRRSSLKKCLFCPKNHLIETRTVFVRISSPKGDTTLLSVLVLCELDIEFLETNLSLKQFPALFTNRKDGEFISSAKLCEIVKNKR